MDMHRLRDPKLRDVTILHVAPGRQPFEPRLQRHDWYELIYIVRGAYEVRTLGTRLSGGRRCAFCFPPRQTHRPRFSSHGRGVQPAEAILLQWTEQPGAPHPGPDYPLRIEDPSQRLFHALHWMLDLHAGPSSSDRAGAQHMLPLFLHELTRNADRLQYVLRSVHTYIEDNLDRTIRLDDLAAAVGMSKYHFVRAFRRLAGQTPMRYVRQQRLRAAHELIVGSRMSLSQVAAHTGFSSAFHLSARFKELTGESPSATRARMPKTS